MSLDFSNRGFEDPGYINDWIAAGAGTVLDFEDIADPGNPLKGRTSAYVTTTATAFAGIRRADTALGWIYNVQPSTVYTVSCLVRGTSGGLMQFDWNEYTNAAAFISNPSSGTSLPAMTGNLQLFKFTFTTSATTGQFRAMSLIQRSAAPVVLTFNVDWFQIDGGPNVLTYDGFGDQPLYPDFSLYAKSPMMTS